MSQFPLGKKIHTIPGMFPALKAHPTFFILYAERSHLETFGQILEVTKIKVVLDDGNNDEFSIEIQYLNRFGPFLTSSK